ncbi:hypothetical protein IW262DRAFT_1301738 [Armillaria fumosa]|nr:hypothetical protein IW262DRAFT_1301738 [Armillaria fumosa]
MSSFSDDNIDPQLHTVNAVDAYINETRCRFQAQIDQARLSQEASQNFHEGSELSSDTQNNTPAMISATALQPPPGNIVATARRLKRKIDLSDEAEADLDDFCVAPPEERLLLLMVISLKNRDYLQQLQESGSAWQLLRNLSKNIWSYVKAFLLSSTAVCWVGDSSYHVMVAMRDMRVGGLPLEDDLTGCAALQSRIPYCLTTKRAQIKEVIKLSLQNTKDSKAIHNIASLTKKLIGQSKSILQTQQLYMRLSVADNYWDEVDRMLQGMRASGDGLFVYALNKTYEKDKEQYRDPVKSGIKSVEIRVAKLPSWVRKVNKLAPKVQMSEGDGESGDDRSICGSDDEIDSESVHLNDAGAASMETPRVE